MTSRPLRAATLANWGLVVPQDDHARNRSWSAHIVRQAERRSLHLPFTAFPLELLYTFVDHADAAGTDRMAERLQPSAGIDGNVTGERCATFGGQTTTFSFGAESQILGIGDLGPGEAIVYLGEVDVARGDSRHLVCLLRRHLCGAETEVVEGRVEIRAPGGDGQ